MAEQTGEDSTAAVDTEGKSQEGEPNCDGRGWEMPVPGGWDMPASEAPDYGCNVEEDEPTSDVGSVKPDHGEWDAQAAWGWEMSPEGPPDGRVEEVNARSPALENPKEAKEVEVIAEFAPVEVPRFVKRLRRADSGRILKRIDVRRIENMQARMLARLEERFKSTYHPSALERIYSEENLSFRSKYTEVQDTAITIKRKCIGESIWANKHFLRRYTQSRMVRDKICMLETLLAFNNKYPSE